MLNYLRVAVKIDALNIYTGWDNLPDRVCSRETIHETAFNLAGRIKALYPDPYRVAGVNTGR